jgi:hypothetical protein
MADRLPSLGYNGSDFVVIGDLEGPGAVKMQKEEGEKCSFAFLRKKIFLRYYKLTKV